MNYPNLETCEAIAGEFTDTYFVYASYDRGTPKVMPRDDVYRRMHQHIGVNDWKIICNIPTCEELGEWLWDNGYQTYRKTHIIDGKVMYGINGNYKKFRVENETQARAEAVKLILEGK